MTRPPLTPVRSANAGRAVPRTADEAAPARAPRLAVLAVAALTLMLGACAGPRAAAPRPVDVSQSSGGATSDVRIARSALDSGDYAMAADLYDKALRAAPQSSEAALGLADTLMQAGKLEAAFQAYTRALTLPTAAPAARLGLARIALKQRRLDDATTQYRAILAEQPDTPLAQAGLGAALDLQGLHEQAQAIYRAGLAARHDDAALRINLGLSLTLSRKPREGANVLLDVAGRSDAPPQGRQNLALAYGLLGNSEAAEKVLLADLPRASAQDDLRFYQAMRKMFAASSPAGSAVSPSAVTAFPLPPLRSTLVPVAGSTVAVDRVSEHKGNGGTHDTPAHTP